MSLYLNLQKYQRDILLQEIKGIKTFYFVKLKAIEYLMTFWCGNKTPVRPYLYVDDKKLHRLYIIDEDGCKIVSLGFNFLIKTYNKDLSAQNNGVTNLNYIGQKGNISLLNVSESQSILSELKFEENSYYWGVDIGMAVSNDSIRFFESIIFSEPSYLRYDNSMLGYKPLIHPRYHFEVCFTPNVSYKIGLPQAIKQTDMENILDKNKFCPVITLKPTLDKIGKCKRKGNNKF